MCEKLKRLSGRTLDGRTVNPVQPQWVREQSKYSQNAVPCAVLHLTNRP
jgi:hypothetical protein